MATTSLTLLSVTLASTLFSLQAAAQAIRDPQFDLAAPFVGKSLTCLQPQKLLISEPFAERAKLKARLLDLLRESLYDDARGIANVARDREINNLANRLKNDKSLGAGKE